MKKVNVPKVCYAASILLLLGFIIHTIVDYYRYYNTNTLTSAPFRAMPLRENRIELLADRYGLPVFVFLWVWATARSVYRRTLLAMRMQGGGLLPPEPPSENGNHVTSVVYSIRQTLICLTVSTAPNPPSDEGGAPKGRRERK